MKKENFKWGTENHDVIGQFLIQVFGLDDIEMRQFAEFIASRYQFELPCWEGCIDRFKRLYWHRRDDLENAFKAYPETHLYERWMFGLEMYEAQSIEDYEALKSSQYYPLLKGCLDRQIRVMKAMENKR